jgi:DNA-binding beta-propeller fold protein YncE
MASHPTPAPGTRPTTPRRNVRVGVLACFLVALLAGSPGAVVPAPAAGAIAPQVDSMLALSVANAGRTFEQPTCVAFDNHSGEIVVANSGLSRIEFFGRDGQPRGYFVHRIVDADGVERDGLPKHVAIDSAGHVLVVDAFVPYIDVCDFRGESVDHITLPAPDDSLTHEGGPGAIEVAPDGRLYVASRGREGRVHVLSPDGRWLATWGQTGKEPGKLSAIAGLAVAPNGEIAVACVLTELGVQVFDADGKYLRGFGVHDLGPGRFSVPSGIVITPDSRYWVSDMMRHNVQVFDSTGTLLGVLGGGEGSASMSYPSALASDGRGMLATVETGGKVLRLMWVR